MMLNRRRDEDDPAEHRVSVFAISVFASCHWRKMVAGFSNLLCYAHDTNVFVLFCFLSLQKCWDLTAVNNVQLQNTEKE